MTFKEEIEQALNEATGIINNGPAVFNQESKALAYELEAEIRENLFWEDPENDTAVHNATSEAIALFLAELEPMDGVRTPQAHFYLLGKITELLRERNERIWMADIMGGSNV